MAALIFDAFAYAHQLRDEGFTERQAEVLARKTTEILQIAIESAREEVQAGELVTKRDLKELELMFKRDLKEVELKLELLIERSKNSTLLWMFTMLTGFAGAIIAIMAKGFHWF
ncbi:MAG: CCDC90 family protein [Pseudomonadota bacterium]|nr:CCDC90 family protein [Pseudomonadota bacterium]